MVGTNNGSFTILECYVEAFPPPLSYWQFGDKIIEGNWKYKLDQQELSAFTFKLILNITYIESNDYGMYKCIAKNERGKTHGVFTVFGQSLFVLLIITKLLITFNLIIYIIEIDPRLPKKPIDEPSYVIYGEVLHNIINTIHEIRVKFQRHLKYSFN
jgi:hypothetical protein